MTTLPELRRDRHDAKVAGVCAALARSWNIDPLLVRLGFVVLSLMTNGFAVIAYLALAALIPERGARTEPLRDLLPFTRTWTSQKLTTVVVAASVVLGLVVSGSGPGAAFVALLVLMILRWGTHHRGPSTPTPPPPPVPTTEFERLSLAWQQRQDNVASGLPPDWSPTPLGAESDPYGLYTPETTTPKLQHPARRRRSVGTWSGIAVGLGLTWSGLAALQVWGGISVPVLAWLSATLAVLALGLTLASRPARASYGRPHFLLTAAILVGVLTSLAMVDVPHVISSESDRTQATVAHTYATLPDTQTFEFGSHTLDLTEVDIDRDRSVRITSELGRLRVLLPRTGNVVVHYRTEMGAVRFDQERVQAGLEMGASWSRIDEPGQPTLTLDLLVEVGALEVVTR